MRPLSKFITVLPVYNEAESIAKTLREINEKVIQKMETSLLVCEDGSTDGTKDVLLNLQDQIPMRLILAPERRGYPRAVREALLSTDSEYVVFMDSDGQYDPQDFWRLYKWIGKADIIMGQRTNRAEPWYRTFLSKGLKLIARVLFGVHCQDLTSAFRLLRGEVGRAIAQEVRYSKYNFWSEFTIRAQAEGYKIIEVPITYRARRGGSTHVYHLSSLPKIVWNELYTLLRTWLDLKLA